MKSTKQPTFDVEAYLISVGVQAKVRTFDKNEIIYSMGDVAKDVFFIRDGSVKRTVVSPSGKQAVVGIFGRGDFLGTLCLSGDPVRIATVTTIAPTTVVEIRRQDMSAALRASHKMCNFFVSYLLHRVAKFERELADHLFHAADKRLARTLIQLTQFGRPQKGKTVIPKVSQESLAEMIGVSRQRVNVLLNKFRQLGFIHYNGELTVNASLSSFIVHPHD